jgi:phosphatidylserine/phosphatidylglycerophosphate/cardiolipin synthase-like enzyme
MSFVYTSGTNPGMERVARVVSARRGRVTALPETKGLVKTYYTKFMRNITILADEAGGGALGAGSVLDSASSVSEANAGQGHSAPSESEDQDSSTMAMLAEQMSTMAIREPATPPRRSTAEATLEVYTPEWLAETSALAGGLRVIETLFHPRIVPCLLSLLNHCKRSLRIACYVIDDYFATAIERCMRRGVSVTIVVDEGRMKVGAKRSMEALLALHEWGATICCRRPYSAMTSAQHEKCWLFDEMIYVCGSLNLTLNSVSRCEEAVVVTNACSAVNSFSEHFQELVGKARVVAAGELAKVAVDPQIKDPQLDVEVE